MKRTLLVLLLAGCHRVVDLTPGAPSDAAPELDTGTSVLDGPPLDTPTLDVPALADPANSASAIGT